MTTKQLNEKYGYKKRVDENGRTVIIVNAKLTEDEALRLANLHFKRNKKELYVKKAYATKNGKKVYFKKKLTVIGEKPVLAVGLL